MGQKEEIETSMAYQADEALIAGELKKILNQELPQSSNKEERELYEEIERRIALENEKLFSDKNASKKKLSNIGLPVKAKLLAASTLAKSRTEIKARKQEAAAKAAADAAKAEEISSLGDDISSKYKVSNGSIKQKLEEDGVFRKFQASESDSSDLDEPGAIDYSPMNKLKRSIKKAKALSKFEKMGLAGKQNDLDDDSDEEMRAVREESEAWLRKQKDLEKQLMAKASKGALRQRYMTKGAETHDDIPATEKRIDELLEKVIKDSDIKIKGKAGFGKGHDRRYESGPNKARTDMADIVKRALALRKEVEEAGSRHKNRAAKKTAKKPFPVKLESSSSESHLSESTSSSDNEENSDTSIKRFDIPDLDSMSESSEDDTEKLEKFRKRNKPKFDFIRKTSSLDLADVDDVMAMEDAKRALGKKPDIWSSKPPGYKKYEPKVDLRSSSNDKGKLKLIETFPPEVEALRAKLALGDFSTSNREFLNSEAFLNSRKEIPLNTKCKSTPAVNKSETPKPSNKIPKSLKQQVSTKIGVKKETSEPEPVKKMVERSKPATDRVKTADAKRRPSVISGKTSSKFI